MDFNRPKILTAWLGYLANRYSEFIKESKHYRCKIVGVETDQETKKILLSVMVSGIKNQIVKYFPKEIVTNDTILSEFSPFDARAITFYALQQEKFNNLFYAMYSISGQEFLNGKTIFILKKLKENGELRKSAQELYCDTELLGQFSHNDLINIISTAIQEQTMEDLQRMEN